LTRRRVFQEPIMFIIYRCLLRSLNPCYTILMKFLPKGDPE
jgi:hypothetical protein